MWKYKYPWDFIIPQWRGVKVSVDSMTIRSVFTATPSAIRSERACRRNSGLFLEFDLGADFWELYGSRS